MKKTILALLIILTFQEEGIKAQTCKSNMLTNPSFSSGINNGWSEFHMYAVWIKSKSGCRDTGVLLSIGSNQGGIEQNVSIKSGQCYDFCICLSSAGYCRARIFAATNDTAVTMANLVNKTWPAGTVQVIDSFDINGTGSNFCKKGWTPSTNYSRIIIINTEDPVNGAGELHLDNVCLSPCSNICDSLKASFTYTKSGLNTFFTNTSRFTGGTITGYQWTFGDAATSTQTNPNHLYASSSTYNVCMIATGQVQSLTCKDTIYNTVTVAKNSLEYTFFEGLKIHNGSDKLSVTFVNEHFNCEILEITGKVVKRFTEVNNLELNNDLFNHGVYIVKITRNGMTYSQRVVF